MLSSNNREELFRKQEPKKQRFAIKKLTVGVASVLIGFTFMGLNASASADDTPAQATDDNGNDNAQSQAATGLQSANVALTNQAGTQVNSAAAKAPVNVAPAMPVADAYQKAVAANVAAQATNANSNSPESANTTADKQVKLRVQKPAISLQQTSPPRQQQTNSALNWHRRRQLFNKVGLKFLTLNGLEPRPQNTTL